MKLPIKFRGKRIDNGEFVYGDYVHRGPEAGRPGIIDDEDFYHEVEPDSVTQLIGFDKDGDEVYADDLDVEKTARKMVEDLATFAKKNHLPAVAAVGDEGFANGSLAQVSAVITNLIVRSAGGFDRPPVPVAVSIAITLAACKVGEHESNIATIRAAIKLAREVIDAIELTVEVSANEEVSRGD